MQAPVFIGYLQAVRTALQGQGVLVAAADKALAFALHDFAI